MLGGMFGVGGGCSHVFWDRVVDGEALDKPFLSASQILKSPWRGVWGCKEGFLRSLWLQQLDV